MEFHCLFYSTYWGSWDILWCQLEDKFNQIKIITQNFIIQTPLSIFEIDWIMVAGFYSKWWLYKAPYILLHHHKLNQSFTLHSPRPLTLHTQSDFNEFSTVSINVGDLWTNATLLRCDVIDTPDSQVPIRYPHLHSWHFPSWLQKTTLVIKRESPFWCDSNVTDVTF